MSGFTDLDLGTVPNDNTGTTLRAGGAIINANNALSSNLTENNVYSANNVFGGFITFGTAVELTIATDILTITQSHILVNGEGDAADDLVTISGYNNEGTILILKRAAGSGTVTVLETGNIRLGATSRLLTETKDKLMLIYDSIAGVWTELSYTDN